MVEFAVAYRLIDEQKSVKAEGDAKAVLDEKYLTLTPDAGEPLLFAYTDITGILDENYRIDLFLSSREKLNLSGLGYQYEDFLFELYRLRNELLLKYMLMEETLLQADFRAHFDCLDPKGRLTQTGECEVRLYESALLVLPQKGEPIRLPCCYLSQTTKADYKLSVVSEFGEKFEFSRLGEKFDALTRALSDAVNKMMLRSQETLKEIVSEADPVALRKLANLMKDGRAARRKDIEQVSSEFWRRLEKKIDESGGTEEYSFLNAMALKEQVCVGVKRGLMGDLTGTYIWLLFPLRDAQLGKLTNAVALEAFSTTQGDTNEAQNQVEPEEAETEKASGKATYFFRMKSLSESAQMSENQLQAELESFSKDLTRCMIEINFRREPIFLTDDSLGSPKYAQYRYAVSKVPSLQKLRSLFIDRVAHTSLDQWKADVTSLLDFNAKSRDHTQKWKRGTK